MRLLALLTIVVWPNGLDAASHQWTLRCGPPGGTLPQPAVACRRLTALGAPFKPVPAGAVCTELYGGPDVARVTGRFRDRKVWSTFRRRNGCETARWDRIAFLLR
jgi:hypothetical protein